MAAMTQAKETETGKATSTSEWVSRATAILAVVAAIASARWGACNLAAILEQGKVNDTWAYYQAKSIKQHEAETARDLSRALAAAGQSGGATAAAALAELERKLDAEAKRQEAEKNQQQAAAERFQASRDRMVESSFWFELAFAGLQLGVILCTIAAGARRKLPWVAGIAFGVVGTLLLVNGFHRFVKAPASWYESGAKQMANEIGP